MSQLSRKNLKRPTKLLSLTIKGVFTSPEKNININQKLKKFNNLNVFNGVNNMNKNNYTKLVVLTLLMLSPALCFASGGDNTFMDVVTLVKGWLGGSLGLLFVFISFLGAAASLAGAANPRVMFPVLFITLVLHYGPGIAEDIFGASGTFVSLTHPQFNAFDLLVLMAASALTVYKKYGNHKQNLELQA